jgi:hypothetical protein
VADELRSVEIARRFAARDQQAGHRKAQYSRVIRESQVEAALSLPADMGGGGRRTNLLIRDGLWAHTRRYVPCTGRHPADLIWRSR